MPSGESQWQNEIYLSRNYWVVSLDTSPIYADRITDRRVTVRLVIAKEEPLPLRVFSLRCPSAQVD
jgi:hypothetical protein